MQILNCKTSIYSTAWHGTANRTANRTEQQGMDGTANRTARHILSDSVHCVLIHILWIAINKLYDMCHNSNIFIFLNVTNYWRSYANWKWVNKLTKVVPAPCHLSNVDMACSDWNVCDDIVPIWEVLACEDAGDDATGAVGSTTHTTVVDFLPRWNYSITTNFL